MNAISASALKELLRSQSDIILIDVREDFEHEDFNIGGHLIPLGEVLNRSAEIPKDKPVYVYCRKGVRSQIAIQRLQDKFGYTNLINLTGGVEAWKKQSNP